MTEGEPSGERVVVRRAIAADRERVFHSWTDPEQLPDGGARVGLPALTQLSTYGPAAPTG